MRLPSRYWTLAVAMALGATGCGSPGSTVLGGITMMRHGFMTSSPAALYEGPIRFEQGCVVAGANPDSDFMPIIWPPMAGLRLEGDDVVVVVNGLVLRDGDMVSLGGGEYTDVKFVEQLSGPIPQACRANYYWLAGDVSTP